MNSFITKLLLGLCLALITVGCGENVFEGIADPEESKSAAELSQNVQSAVTEAEIEEVIDDVEELVRDSSDPGDYTPIKSVLSEVISSNVTSPQQKQQAQALKGEVILGENNVTPLDVAEKLEDLSEDDTEQENVLDSLEVDAPLANLAEAADSYNAAATSNAGSLNKDQQLNRGISNVLTVTTKISEVYDIDNDGDVTAKDSNKTNTQLLNDVLEPIGNNSRTIADYAEDSVSAFENTNFDNEKIGDLRKISTATRDLERLQTAVNGNANTFTVGGETFQIKNGNGTPNDTAVGNAIDKIFESTNE